MAPVLVFPGGEPGETLGPGAGFTSAILVAEHQTTGTDGHPVHLFRVFPVYPSELTFEATHGIGKLFAAFDAAGVTLAVDPKRQPVA